MFIVKAVYATCCLNFFTDQPQYKILSKTSNTQLKQGIKFVIYFSQRESPVEDEVAPEVELSALVNYIQPVHFKSFEHSESKLTTALSCH